MKNEKIVKKPNRFLYLLKGIPLFALISGTILIFQFISVFPVAVFFEWSAETVYSLIYHVFPYTACTLGFIITSILIYKRLLEHLARWLLQNEDSKEKGE